MSVIQPYRLIDPVERDATFAAFDHLVAVARKHRREGWRSWEADPIVGEARTLGLSLWPSYIQRVLRAARYS